MTVEWSNRQLHRQSVSANDSVDPAVSAGIDCTGYKYAMVDVAMSGGGFDITPMFAFNSWYRGDTQAAITVNTRFKVEVNGASRLYIYLTNRTSSGVATIHVTPFN